MNPRLQALHPYPFERLARLQARRHAACAPAAHRPVDRRAAARAAAIRARDAAAQPAISSAATPRPPACRSCAPRAPRWLTRRYRPDGRQRRSGLDGAAGQRHARGAVRLRAGGGRSRSVHRSWRCRIRSIRSTKARRCWPAPSRTSSTPPPASGYLPDLAAVPEAIWQRCQVLFLCSPGNPTGAVLPLEYLRRALELAERHDFIIASR